MAKLSNTIAKSDEFTQEKQNFPILWVEEMTKHVRLMMGYTNHDTK
jgi:hypothetical protein